MSLAGIFPLSCFLPLENGLKFAVGIIPDNLLHHYARFFYKDRYFLSIFQSNRLNDATSLEGATAKGRHYEIAGEIAQVMPSTFSIASLRNFFLNPI